MFGRLLFGAAVTATVSLAVGMATGHSARAAGADVSCGGRDLGAVVAEHRADQAFTHGSLIQSAPQVENPFGVLPGAASVLGVARVRGSGMIFGAQASSIRYNARYRDWAARMERRTCSRGSIGYPSSGCPTAGYGARNPVDR